MAEGADASPPTVGAAATTSAGAPQSERLIGQWVVEKQIGKGSFAVVWRARHKDDTRKVVAIKEIRLEALNKKLRESLESEISVLQRTRHSNIIRLHEILKEKTKIFLVLEYCAGGDVSDFIRRAGRTNEATARYLMTQMAAGLKAMRDKNLIHRDLKPQNLLLSSPTSDATLKIADFGFARYIQPMGMAETLCGSPLYMAPEILQFQKYDAKADLWSVGAILYELVVGRPPFTGQNPLQLLKNIERSDAVIPARVASHLSKDCISLLRGLLRRNPVERMSFDDFFAHPFFTRSGAGAGVAGGASPSPARAPGTPACSGGDVSPRSASGGSLGAGSGATSGGGQDSSGRESRDGSAAPRSSGSSSADDAMPFLLDEDGTSTITAATPSTPTPIAAASGAGAGASSGVSAGQAVIANAMEGALSGNIVASPGGVGRGEAVWAASPGAGSYGRRPGFPSRPPPGTAKQPQQQPHTHSGGQQGGAMAMASSGLSDIESEYVIVSKSESPTESSSSYGKSPSHGGGGGAMAFPAGKSAPTSAPAHQMVQRSGGSFGSGTPPLSRTPPVARTNSTSGGPFGFAGLIGRPSNASAAAAGGTSPSHGASPGAVGGGGGGGYVRQRAVSVTQPPAAAAALAGARQSDPGGGGGGMSASFLGASPPALSQAQMAMTPASRMSVLERAAGVLRDAAMERWESGGKLDALSLSIVSLAALRAAYALALDLAASAQQQQQQQQQQQGDAAKDSVGSAASSAGSAAAEGDGASAAAAAAAGGSGGCGTGSGGGSDAAKANAKLSKGVERIKSAFVAALGRAERAAAAVRAAGMDDSAKLPDGMELAYQTALSLGRAGAVDELMGNLGSSLEAYGRAQTLLMFLLGECQCPCPAAGGGGARGNSNGAACSGSSGSGSGSSSGACGSGAASASTSPPEGNCGVGGGGGGTSGSSPGVGGGGIPHGLAASFLTGGAGRGGEGAGGAFGRDSGPAVPASARMRIARFVSAIAARQAACAAAAGTGAGARKTRPQAAW